MEDIDKITLDQLIDIFRIYEVDLDVEAAQSITDSAGFITKEDFMKFGKDRNLVDFNDRREKDDSPEWAPTKSSSKVEILALCKLWYLPADKLHRVVVLLWWDSEP